MRKLTPVLVVAVVALGFASCKKEAVAPAAPSVKLKTISDLKDVGTWDNGDSSNVGASGLRAASTTTTTDAPAAKTKKPKKK